MTDQDPCATDYPHPAHRTQYGPFGVKDCPGVPMTPMECDAAYVPEPHEDPARLREQLAEAHADCARYATERDEAARICGEAGIEIDRLRAERDVAQRESGEACGELARAWAALNRAGISDPIAGVGELIDRLAADRNRNQALGRMVWLGDLSGYQLDADAGQVLVRHRCGWTYEVDNPVIAYLANLLTGPVEAHRDAGCNPHEG